MQFRWVAAITVWTFISGPLLGPPHAPIPKRDTQLSPLRQAAEQPPPRQPSTPSKILPSSMRQRAIVEPTSSKPSWPPSHIPTS